MLNTEIYRTGMQDAIQGSDSVSPNEDYQEGYEAGLEYLDSSTFRNVHKSAFGFNPPKHEVDKFMSLGTDGRKKCLDILVSLY